MTDTLCSPPEGRAEYWQKTHSCSPSKGSSCALPSRYMFREAAAPLWLLIMFWCEVANVIYNMLQKKTKTALMLFILGYVYWTPTASCSRFSLGEQGMHISFSTVTSERTLKISSQGKWEKERNLKGSLSCIHHGHTDPGFCRLQLFRELMGGRSEQEYSSVRYNVGICTWTSHMQKWSKKFYKWEGPCHIRGISHPCVELLSIIQYNLTWFRKSLF